MDHYSIIIVNLLQILAFSTADKVILQRWPTKLKKWNHWTTSRPNSGLAGWDKTRDATGIPRYSSCVVSGQQPNLWLKSNRFQVPSTVRQVYVTIQYRSRNCTSVDGADFCRTYFDFYVHQVPEPLGKNSTYAKISEMTAPIPGDNAIVTKAVGVPVKGRFITLAFHNQGSCSVIYSVIVSYFFCPEFTVTGGLVSLPRSMAPENYSEPVEGRCVINAVPYRGNVMLDCQSDGFWNISSLQGSCVCKEDMENAGGECKDCPDRNYNEQNGLNCTVLPSTPKDVTVAFVNRSGVEITWKSPEETGDQTHVSYDVNCLIRKMCSTDDADNCLYEHCSSDVRYIPSNKGLEINNVIVIGLSPFVNYTFKIFAKNRASEVAKRIYGDEGNFATLNIMIGGLEVASTIGSPRSEASSETISTKLEKVYSTDTASVFYLKIIYGLVGLIVLIISLICYFTFKRWRLRRQENDMQVTAYLEVREYDAIQMLSECPLIVAEDQTTNEIWNGFELDRTQLKFIKLLGTGNFGQVSKAIYGPSQLQVAVKSLKENTETVALESIIKELEVMKFLRAHPHVVGLIGHCIERDPVYIVLEYLPYGDLLGYLRKSRGIEDTYNTGEKRPSSPLNEKDLLSFAWMIADGMGYLASMKTPGVKFGGKNCFAVLINKMAALRFENVSDEDISQFLEENENKNTVVHRDLAARNVLVGENRVCKISDFGLARSLEEDIYTRRTQARLPIKWMSPESIFKAESTTKSDVWSYGIVVWELLTLGGSPYPDMSVQELIPMLEGGYRMPKPNHVSEKLYAIMMECWNEQPENRPTFSWICVAVKRLLDDDQVYVNLEGYDDQEYLVMI